MPIIKRNITRALFNTDEITSFTSTPASGTTPLAMITTDFLYLGYKQRFASRYFSMNVANTEAATLSVEYWDGSDWQDVEDLCDQTLGMTQDGFISWINQNDWDLLAQTPVLDKELYWVRISTDTNFSAGTIINAILNLFTDDESLRRFYPELITDTRWLPSGRTDFLEQYEQAKDMVVLRLKQDGLITEEAQILDPNEVANAASHAAAWVIKNGIAETEEDRATAAEIFRLFTRELNRVKLDIDLDKSGVLEDNEENEGNFFIPRGGF